MSYKLTIALTAWGALASLALAIVALGAAAQTGGVPFMPPPAQNNVARMTTCFGPPWLASCTTTFRTLNINPHVIPVPPPSSEQEMAESELRDRRWVERCKPTIRQDAYGVPRYVYAARGCEYGRLD